MTTFSDKIKADKTKITSLQKPKNYPLIIAIILGNVLFDCGLFYLITSKAFILELSTFMNSWSARFILKEYYKQLLLQKWRLYFLLQILIISSSISLPILAYKFLKTIF